MASAGQYASLQLAADRQSCQHPTTQFFTGRMPFLLPNQQSCRLAYFQADATATCFSKIQIGFAFLVPAHLSSPGKRAVKRVCVLYCFYAFTDLLAEAGGITFLGCPSVCVAGQMHSETGSPSTLVCFTGASVARQVFCIGFNFFSTVPNYSLGRMSLN